MSSVDPAQQNAAASTRLYRAVWRRHFCAGLFAIIDFLLPRQIKEAGYQT